MRNKKPVRKLKKEKSSKKSKNSSPPTLQPSASPPIHIAWAFWYFFIDQIGKKSLLVPRLPFLNWSPSNILIVMWNDLVSSFKSFFYASRDAWSGFTRKIDYLCSLLVNFLVVITNNLLTVCRWLPERVQRKCQGGREVKLKSVEIITWLIFVKPFVLIYYCF